MPQLTLQQAFDLAVRHHQAGRLGEAEALYRQILAQQPGHADALHMLGVIACQVGRYDLAVDLIRQAIACQPNWPEAYYNLGNALKDAGQLDQAVAGFRQAIILRPTYAEAYNNLGNALRELGRLDQAIAACRQAAALRPDYPGAYYNLGTALQAKGQVDECIAAYRQAIARQPNYSEACNNLGTALKDAGHIEEAIAAYRQALALNARYAEAYSNLGVALQSTGHLDEAIAASRQAIALKPDLAEAHSNLGVALADNGQLNEAVAACRQAISLNSKPENGEGFNNLLYALYHDPQCSVMQLLETTRQWACQQPVVTPGYAPNRDRNPNRKLKIGYVSGSFVMSADAHFTLPLLAHHDHTQFEIFAYTRALRHDDFSRRLQAHCDHWIDIRPLRNPQTVELLRSHELDILVNVSNPADPCRRLFASRMAPIQMLWLIFASCTSGLPTVDYRISDPYVDPPGLDESCYAEKTLRLPETAWCYDPLAEALPVEPLPALSNGFVTFGSLHRLVKLNPQVIAAWAQILGAVPKSRLHVLAVAGNARQRLLDQFRDLGVDGTRIEFIGKLPRRDYLKQHHRLDMMLDTFPFAGHTTVFDALWMGVPVVTAVGGTVVSRAGASALYNLDLADLIGHTPAEYVQIAVKLAGDISRLKELRARLRPRMEASPLMDAARFAGNLEAVYRQVWRRWCAQ